MAQVAQAAAPQSALLIQDVSKNFKGVVAVDGINLELRKGEFLTLLGSSGSGKTTTLNMVAGFLQPSAGRIIIDGRDSTHLPPHKRGIGMVFQNYALFPHLTVAENIAFPLTRTPKAERTRLIREALRQVGLEKLEDRFPRQLSGGQQQRVAFARAVVYQPRLLLMDEPFGALDKKLRETLQLEVKRLHKELGITILHVTHDQEEALVLSDRIAVFRQGRIEQLDAPRDLYDFPRSVFVADFIGESNIFRGLVQRDGNVTAVEGDGWRLCGSALSSQTCSEGSQAGLVVRPDCMKLVPADTPGTANHQRINGRVRQLIYLGSDIKFELEALGQIVFSRSRVDASAFLPRPGEPVALEWPLERGIIVPGS